MSVCLSVCRKLWLLFGLKQWNVNSIYVCLALSLPFVKAHTYISCRPFEIRKQRVPVEFRSQYTVLAKSLDLLKPQTKAWFTFVLSFYISNYTVFLFREQIHVY